MQWRQFVIPAITTLLVGAGRAPASFTLDFSGGNITHNTSAIGSAFRVTVFGQADGGAYAGLGAHQVVFLFSVKSGGLGEVAEMYFQDGTLLGLSAVNFNNSSINGV